MWRTLNFNGLIVNESICEKMIYKKFFSVNHNKNKMFGRKEIFIFPSGGFGESHSTKKETYTCIICGLRMVYVNHVPSNLIRETEFCGQKCFEQYCSKNGITGQQRFF